MNIGKDLPSQTLLLSISHQKYHSHSGKKRLLRYNALFFFGLYQVMANKILFWKGCVNPNLFGEHRISIETALDKLATGDYKSADLDLKKSKLQQNLYTAKINDTHRLLWTTVPHQGKPYMLLLDIIEEHEYEKSPYFRRRTSKQSFDRALAARNADTADAPITAADFEVLTDEDFAALPAIENAGSSDTSIDYIPSYNYDQQFLVFSDEQERAVHATLPALVSGPPGSGKSSTALEMINQLLEKTEQPILYITESPKLAARMGQIWQQMPEAEANKERVHFLSYRDLLLKTMDAANPGWRARFKTLDEFKTWCENTFVSQKTLDVWLSDYIKTIRKLHKTTQKNAPNAWDTLERSLDLIYQEFRIISGYSKEEYLALGERGSLFHSAEEREALFTAYQSYTTHLKDKGQIDESFFKFSLPGVFSAVVVDETQDFSNQQINNINTLVSDEMPWIAYNLDSNQSLSDSLSKKAFLRQRHRQANQQLTSVELTGTYRCPNQVIGLANKVLEIITHLRGGVAEKGQLTALPEANDLSKPAGSVEWFTKDVDKSSDLKRPQRNTVTYYETALITEERFKQEAEGLFHTDLIFTPEEIKGLEYPNIILYRPNDWDMCFDINKALTKRPLTGQISPNLAKNTGVNAYSPALNRLFTAITRASSSVYIYQGQPKRKPPLLEALKTCISASAASAATPEPGEVSSNILDEKRLETIKALLDNDNEEQAQKLFLQIPGKTKTEFKAFKARYEQELINTYVSADLHIAPQRAKATIPEKKKPSAFTLFPNVGKFYQEATASKLSQLLNCHDATRYLLQPVNVHQFPLAEEDFPMLAELLLLDKTTRHLFQQALSKKLDEPNAQAFAAELRAATNVNKQLLIFSIAHITNPKVRRALITSETVHQRNSEGDTPLMAAIMSISAAPGLTTSEQDIACIEDLISAGADVNAVNKAGFSALHFAAQYGLHELAAVLLRHGANPNLAANNTTTPLILAFETDHPSHSRDPERLVKLLLDYNANPQPIVKDITTPLQAALALESSEKKRRCLQLLVSRGADVNQLSSTGSLLLAEAAYQNRKKEMDLLLECGANPNLISNVVDLSPFFAEPLRKQFLCTQNQIRATPLGKAVIGHHVSLIEDLVKTHHADINLCDTQGYSPLVIASCTGNLASIRKLLELGADAKGTGLQRPPIYFALKNSFLAAAKILLEAGGGDAPQLETLLNDSDRKLLQHIRQTSLEELSKAEKLIQAAIENNSSLEHSIMNY